MPKLVKGNCKVMFNLNFEKKNLNVNKKVNAMNYYGLKINTLKTVRILKINPRFCNFLFKF